MRNYLNWDLEPVSASAVLAWVISAGLSFAAAFLLADGSWQQALYYSVAALPTTLGLTLVARNKAWSPNTVKNLAHDHPEVFTIEGPADGDG